MAQYVLVITTFIKCRVVVEIQMRFMHEFHVDRHSRIPSFNIILKWTETFQNIGNVCEHSTGS